MKAAKRIKTHGLTHISLAVRDPDRSLKFYRSLFGVKEYYRDENSIQVLGPGLHDVMAFERDSRKAGKRSGIDHFGFVSRLQRTLIRLCAKPSAPAERSCGVENSRRDFHSSMSKIPTDMRLRSGTNDKAGAPALPNRTNCIQHPYRVSGGFHIMNSHNMRSVKDGSDNRRECSIKTLISRCISEQLPNKRLP